MSEPIIYQPWHSNFGDIWATVQLLLHKSTMQDDPVFLSTVQNGQSLGQVLVQIYQLLRHPFPRHRAGGLILVDVPGNTELSGYDVWATPYYPVRTEYHPWSERAEHRTICYQFDGLNSPHLTNPPPGELAILLTWLHASGFEAVRLGKPMSPQECVTALGQAVAFVGVDSGMSHIAHSTGTPIFLLEYQLPVVTTHRGKAYIHCSGTEDLLRHKWPTYVDMLRFIGHPDGERSTVMRPRKERERLAEQGVQWWLPEEARTRA